MIGSVISLEDGLRLVSSRAQLLVDHCHSGSTGMLAIGMAEDNALKFIDEQEFADLDIACDNGPDTCVVGGPNKTLSALSAKLQSAGIRCTLLDVPFAYHTEHVAAIVPKLTEQAQQISLQTARIPVILNATGTILDVGEQLPTAEYFAQHCRHKVMFSAGIAAAKSRLPELGNALWIEIGPHASVLPMIRPQIDSENAVYLPSLDRSSHCTASILNALHKAAEKGIGLSWRHYFEDMINKPRLIPALGMTFQEVDYLVPYVEKDNTERPSITASPSKSLEEAPLPYRFLSRVTQNLSEAREAVAAYETDIKILDAHIVGHSVCGTPLCPASVFHELALSATSHAFGVPPIGNRFLIEAVAFSKPLVTSVNSSRIIVTKVKLIDKSAQAFRFEISSRDSMSAKVTAHCSGSVNVHLDTTIRARTDRLLAEGGKIKARLEHSTSQILSRRTIYDQIFCRVVAYSELYRSIYSLKVNSTADEGIAYCTYPLPTQPVTTEGTFFADPVMMDSLLHTSGFLCNMSAANGEIFIAHSVDEACLLRPDFEPNFEVRCTNVNLNGGMITIGDAVAVNSTGVIAYIRGLHFQKLQLSRMSAALSYAMGCANPSSVMEERAGPSQPVKAVSGPAQQHTPSSRSFGGRAVPPRQELAAAPSLAKDTSANCEDAILQIIANARNAPKSSINPSMSLAQLGVDSLLMLEMEASFRRVGSFTSMDFERCLTVGDIVQLVASTEHAVQLPETPVVSDSTVKPTMVPTIPQKALYQHHDAVREVIAKASNATKSSIKLSTSLDDLGIDSLLMIEMENSFHQIGHGQFTSVDYEKCLTVGDIVNLIDSVHGVKEINRNELYHMESVAAASTPWPASTSVPSSDLAGAVIKAIAKACRVDLNHVLPTANMDELGIDSLMMLELEDKFHELSPSGFKTAYLKDCRTVRDVVGLVSCGSVCTADDTTVNEKVAGVVANSGVPVPRAPVINKSAKPQSSKISDPNRRKRIPMDAQLEKMLIDRLGLAQQPELLQSAPPVAEPKPAIFLIHAGSGFSRPYYRLSSLVDRNIWAIHDDKLLKQEEPWLSVAHVAQTYAGFIRRTSKGQSAIISGWSFGGIIAYEVAKLLQREGKTPIHGLILVDPPPPNGYTNPRVAELLHRLFAKMFGVDSARQNTLGDALHKIAASNAIRCADLMETYVPNSAGKPPKTAFLYATDPVTTDFLSEEGDEHAPYDAWLCEREDRGLALDGWFELLGRDIKVIDLPGNHYNILERDKVQTTSAAYIEACNWIEMDS